MKSKILTGAEGRSALYALAAATGEAVFALGCEREELRALAEAGAHRSRSDRPPAVVAIQDASAFAASVGRLSWKRIPTQILIDGTGVDGIILDQIAGVLSTVAPVIIATSGRDEQVPR